MVFLRNGSLVRIIPYFLLLVLLLADVRAYGQNTAEAGEYPVAVFHRGDDAIGREIAQRVRAGFQDSAEFTYNMDADLLIILHTQDVRGSEGDVETNGNFGVVNVIWTLRDGPEDTFPRYLESTLGYLGNDRIGQVSKGIVGDTQQIVTAILPKARGE